MAGPAEAAKTAGAFATVDGSAPVATEVFTGTEKVSEVTGTG